MADLLDSIVAYTASAADFFNSIDPKETFAGGETKVRVVNVHAPK